VEARLKVLQGWTQMAPAAPPSKEQRIYHMLENRMRTFLDGDNAPGGTDRDTDWLVKKDSESSQTQERDDDHLVYETPDGWEGLYPWR